jgi:hypothetical protein
MIPLIGIFLFAKKKTVTFTNPFTAYDTPAGYYCYPLDAIKHGSKTIYQELLDLSKKYDKDFDIHSRVFPYGPGNIIQIIKVKSNANILSWNTSFKDVKYYLNKLYKHLESNNITNDENVFSFIEYAINYYNDSENKDNLRSIINSNNFIELDKKYKRQLFDIIHYDGELAGNAVWFFVLASLNAINKDDPKKITNTFVKLGIDGFRDSENKKWFIHPNEELQAVLFKKSIIEESYSYIQTNK